LEVGAHGCFLKFERFVCAAIAHGARSLIDRTP
jgi:hypothetical protein